MKPCLAVLRELMIATFVIGSAFGQHCTEANFDTCLYSYFDFYTLTNVTEAVLNDGCRNLNNISLCMKNFGCAEKPISDPNKSWNGIKDASTFVCTKRSDVLKNWPCWKSVFEMKNVGICWNVFAIDTYEPSQPPCYAINELVQCIKSNITAVCGSAAGDLYAEYLYKGLIGGISDVNRTCAPGSESEQQCTQDNLDTCINPYFTFFTLVYATEAVVNDGCSNLSNVSLCMKNFGCAEEPISGPNILWNGLKDASTFVCSKRSDVLKNLPCWRSVIEVSDLSICFDAYAIDMNKPSQPPCYAVNELIQCVTSNVTAQCGSAAGDLYAVFCYKQFIGGIYDANRACALDNTVTTAKPDSSAANPESQDSLLSWLLLASVAAFFNSSIRN